MQERCPCAEEGILYLIRKVPVVKIGGHFPSALGVQGQEGKIN